jgi:hypothetical protein
MKFKYIKKYKGIIMLKEIIEAIKVKNIVEGVIPKNEVEKIYSDLKTFLPKIFTDDKIKKMEEITEIPGDGWIDEEFSKGKIFAYKSYNEMPWIGVLMLDDKLFILSFPSKKMGEAAKKSLQSFVRVAKKTLKEKENVKKIDTTGYPSKWINSYYAGVDVGHGIWGIFGKNRWIIPFVNCRIGWYDENDKFHENAFSMANEDIKNMFEDMVNQI